MQRTMGALAVLGVVVLVLVLAGVPFTSAQEAPAAEQPQAWEYHVVSARELIGGGGLSIDELRDPEALRAREAAALEAFNALGREGWRLVQVHEDHYFFIRRL